MPACLPGESRKNESPPLVIPPSTHLCSSLFGRARALFSSFFLFIMRTSALFSLHVQPDVLLPPIPPCILSLSLIHPHIRRCFELFCFVSFTHMSTQACPQSRLRPRRAPPSLIPTFHSHSSSFPPLCFVCRFDTHNQTETYKPRHIHVRALPARTLPHHMH